MSKTKLSGLGRYMMGVGIGIMIGVSQTLMPWARHHWWWTRAVEIVGLIVMFIGFELTIKAQEP